MLLNCLIYLDKIMEKNIEISLFGNNLMFKTGYTKDLVFSIIKEKKLEGLKINTRWEGIKSLDFLSEYEFIESLEIVGNNDFDFSFLFSLKNLKKLSISIVGNNPIDFSNQTNLEMLTIQWRKGNIIGLDKCSNMSTLCLVDYVEDDFTSINKLINLNDLKVKTASIKKLNGIENFVNLKHLLLGNCKKLTSIDELKSLSNLISLSFELCSQIKDYFQIGSLSNLENLKITDCKGIDSIKFIENLSSLKMLSLLGNTDVLDGDLIPAKNIKEVFYKHRKHYNIKIENIDNEELVKRNLEKIRNLFK